MLQSKKCTRCGKLTPFDGFYKNVARRDGYDSWCKACKRDYNANQRKLRLEDKKKAGKPKNHPILNSFEFANGYILQVEDLGINGQIIRLIDPNNNYDGDEPPAVFLPTEEAGRLIQWQRKTIIGSQAVCANAERDK